MLLMGNFYEANIEMGRYDADYGNILFNRPGGLSNGIVQSMKITGEVRNIRHAKVGDSEIIIIAKNNEPIQVIRISQAHGDP
jgi:hypothetical protein